MVAHKVAEEVGMRGSQLVLICGAYRLSSQDIILMNNVIAKLAQASQLMAADRDIK